ncbi:MAG: 3-dehydroquinate synthase II [Deltaproteobacteria bacterium]|nr:3-dehydroquinate synthase II [Deltaproteobacteria bacterium]
MKEIWVNADPWEKELVTTALESGADAVIVPNDMVEKVEDLGIITVVSHEGGDIRWDEDVVRMEINSSDDEDEIVRLSRSMRVIVKPTDWEIIPLENLVARTGNIFLEVNDLESAETALTILEKGIDGIIIADRDPIRVREIISRVRGDGGTMDLTEFQITHVRTLRMGHRVCVDTCTMMKQGEGALVGNSSGGLFLVHSESIENPYVSPRPFRVNAGPVHAYIMAPGGRTRYLSELGAGDEILGVDWEGSAMPLVVGRVKVERRPLILVEASGPNGPVTTILQNAETIRLVTPEGKPLSVVRIKPGDRVLGHAEEAGRHFGHRIEETITEK